MKEIACPADCGWLGGLAVTAGLVEPAAEEVRAAMDDARASLALWIRTYPRRTHFFERAVEEVFGDDDPEESDSDWIADIWGAGVEHGVVDEKGRRLVEVMLAERARETPPAQVAALRSLATTWFSAFRVLRVDVDQGLLLRDVVDDSEVFVHEKLATHDVQAAELLLAFIGTTGGVEHLHAIVSVPAAHDLRVIDRLRALRDEAGALDRVAATPRVWGRTLGTLWRLVRDWRPEVRNTDGDELVPSRAFFDVVDEQALRRALASAPDLEVDASGAAWGWRRGEGDEGLSLGRLELDGRRLVLEVNSRERLQRGKAWIAAAAGTAVVHRLDEHADLDHQLHDLRSGPSGDDDAHDDQIPDDVQRHAIGKVLRHMYRNVLDEPVPMLGGATPRQAVGAGADGKRRVGDWLDGLEHSLLGMPGASDAVDVDAWRVELGVEPRGNGPRAAVGIFEDDEDDEDDEEGLEPDWVDVFDPDEVEALAERVEVDQRGWLDEASPLLDGKSPRVAARDPALRYRVFLLIDGVDECSALDTADIDAIIAELGLDTTALTYDPSAAPRAELWLACHERERERAVRDAHERLPHPVIADRDRHAIEHQVIESWIARDTNDAPRALERLRSAGLTRHEAIHALGAAFGQLLDRAMQRDSTAPLADLTAMLAAVDPGPWRGTMR